MDANRNKTKERPVHEFANEVRKSAGFTIRAAQEIDVPVILQLIRELAEYERLLHEVTATEAGLRQRLFGARPYAEALVAEVDESAAGFALFFHNFSTFLGKPGVYLEDIFVRPEYRGRGIGTAFFRQLAQLALERDCGRLEWAVLNWNEPALKFYRSLGAASMSDWTVQRVTGEGIKRLAQM
jgi:GNAT superfamily N-acetyltransferase